MRHIPMLNQRILKLMEIAGFYSHHMKCVLINECYNRSVATHALLDFNSIKKNISKQMSQIYFGFCCSYQYTILGYILMNMGYKTGHNQQKLNWVCHALWHSSIGEYDFSSTKSLDELRRSMRFLLASFD